jgi:hypothetical protein
VVLRSDTCYSLKLTTASKTSHIQIISGILPAPLIGADPGKSVTLLIHLSIAQEQLFSGKDSEDKRLTLRKEFLALMHPSVRKILEERPITITRQVHRQGEADQFRNH